MGMLMLVIASLLTAEWVRSQGSWAQGRGGENVLIFICRNWMWLSLNESLVWVRLPDSDIGTRWPFLHVELESTYGPAGFFEFRDMEWSWRWYGFGAGDFMSLVRNDLIHNRFWSIPYWSLTIPSALASAYFLLTSARKSHPKSTPDSINAKHV